MVAALLVSLLEILLLRFLPAHYLCVSLVFDSTERKAHSLQGLAAHCTPSGRVKVLRLVPLVGDGGSESSHVHRFEVPFSVMVRYGFLWDWRNTKGNGCGLECCTGAMSLIVFLCMICCVSNL
jgi:hypothetical protein